MPTSSSRCGASTERICARSLGSRRWYTIRSSSSLTTTTLLFECRSIPLNFIWASFGLKRDRTLTLAPPLPRGEEARYMIITPDVRFLGYGLGHGWPVLGRTRPDRRRYEF